MHVKIIWTFAFIGLSCVSADFIGYSLPKDPFLVVWNVPSYRCEKDFGADYKIDMEVLRGFGFAVNPISYAKNGYSGRFITIFYEDMGLWPHYKNDTAVNGGLPQFGNLDAHLAKVEKDVHAKMNQDENFQGIGVIDMEFWKPQFTENYGKNLGPYQTRMIEAVKKQPGAEGWSDAKIQEEAKIQFENNAKHWFNETLVKIKSLYPKGKWGYYHYPYCAAFSGKKRCETAENDAVKWLYDDSTGFYPSVYLYSAKEEYLGYNKGYIQHTIDEAKRLSNGRAPVYVYTTYHYGHSTVQPFETYTPQSLDDSLGQMKRSGIAGAIMWGSWKDFGTKEKCLAFRKYLNEDLGPYVKKLNAQR